MERMASLRPGIAAALALFCASAFAAGGDPVAGRQKAAMVCQVCHGLDGRSVRPDAPHLAGQPAIYVSKVLNEFKAGTRRHEVMSVIARTLSAEDIGNVAAWYESIAVSVTLPAQ